MKPSSFLVNTARGGIVNENDLFEALSKGVIAGAGFDVLTCEPPSADHILLKAPNFLLTPHIAWTSIESRRRLVNGIADNIKLFLAGRKNEIDLCQL